MKYEELKIQSSDEIIKKLESERILEYENNCAQYLIFHKIKNLIILVYTYFFEGHYGEDARSETYLMTEKDAEKVYEYIHQK